MGKFRATMSADMRGDPESFASHSPEKVLDDPRLEKARQTSTSICFHWPNLVLCCESASIGAEAGFQPLLNGQGELLHVPCPARWKGRKCGGPRDQLVAWLHPDRRHAVAGRFGTSPVPSLFCWFEGLVCPLKRSGIWIWHREIQFERTFQLCLRVFFVAFHLAH